MGLAQCLKQAYVKFTYYPPSISKEPKDCTKVTFKAAEVSFPGWVEVLCADADTSGLGSVLLLLEIRNAFVRWEAEFTTKDGYRWNETHAVMVDMPMLFKLDAPIVMLTVVSPWPVKLVRYMALIHKAFMKLDEVGELVDREQFLKNGLCPKDIEKFKKAISDYEDKLNRMLRQASQGMDDSGIAKLLQRKIPHGGYFAATRLA